MNNIFFMKQAIREALKANPNLVYPNPLVGCVIVKDNQIVGQGYHEAFGGNHAELNAIKSLKIPVKNADLYVTLEPCAHFGKKPPCVDAIVNSKMFKRVFIASKDPNKRAHGGIKKLKNEGVEVYVGDCEKEAIKINSRFFTYYKKNRPFIILKFARTSDGFIAHPDGSSKWITNSDSRHDAHQTRAGCDAILVGRTTVEIDNPILDSHGVGKDPKVIILSSVQLSNTLKIMKRKPIIFGKDKLRFSDKENIKIILDNLYSANVQSLLVEGGGKTITSFIKSGYFDEIHEYVSPKKFIKGIPFYNDDNFDEILSSMELTDKISFNNDIKNIYRKKCLLD
tara:strand:+ start:11137 stop:12153 length:1017 start_codon:yes stop_codon:yes gene_type:complete